VFDSQSTNENRHSYLGLILFTAVSVKLYISSEKHIYSGEVVLRRVVLRKKKMKSQYLIASLIVGILTVSANYANTHNLLLLQENAPRTVKTLKQGKLRAQVPPNRGVPTRRESGGARTLKQAESNTIQQQLVAGK
jgi:hypothetical protein